MDINAMVAYFILALLIWQIAIHIFRAPSLVLPLRSAIWAKGQIATRHRRSKDDKTTVRWRSELSSGAMDHLSFLQMFCGTFGKHLRTVAWINRMPGFLLVSFDKGFDAVRDATCITNL